MKLASAILFLCACSNTTNNYTSAPDDFAGQPSSDMATTESTDLAGHDLASSHDMAQQVTYDMAQALPPDMAIYTPPMCGPGNPCTGGLVCDNYYCFAPSGHACDLNNGPSCDPFVNLTCGPQNTCVTAH